MGCTSGHGRISGNICSSSISTPLEAATGDPAGFLPSADPQCVYQLSLGFAKLTRVPTLPVLPNLRALQLNNNSLASVEGLSALASTLVRLDLSFNTIPRIDCLSTLTKLEDLSLYSNQIVVLDPLAHLTRLRVLSIGNNPIHSVDQLATLRVLPLLRCLTAQGTPLCRADPASYRAWAVAHLSRLLYFDHRRVGREERETAAEQHQTELLVLREHAVREAEHRQESAAIAAKTARLEACGLAGLASFLSGLTDSHGSFPGLMDAWPDHRGKLAIALEACQERLGQQAEHAARALRDHQQDSRAMVEDLESEARALIAEVEALLKRARKAVPAAGQLGQADVLAALDRLAEVEGRLEELGEEGSQAGEDQLCEFEDMCRGQGEAALSAHRELFAKVERSLGDFWQAVRAAVPELQAKLERHGTTWQHLPVDLQEAVNDRSFLLSTIDQAQEAQLEQVTAIKGTLEGSENDKVEGKVAAERLKCEQRGRARSSEIAAWVNNVRQLLYQLQTEPVS
ncbi:hypothetical protein N2152v2_006889 [Parachlorella kessleri]